MVAAGSGECPVAVDEGSVADAAVAEGEGQAVKDGGGCHVRAGCDHRVEDRSENPLSRPSEASRLHWRCASFNLNHWYDSRSPPVVRSL